MTQLFGREERSSVAEARAIAEGEARGPALAPERVKCVDEAPVPERRARAEQPVSHRLEGFAQVGQILLTQHGAIEIALPGRIAERATRKRGGHLEGRRGPEPALFELADEQARERVALLARRAVHALAVLQPLPVADLDGAALDFDHEQAAIGDRQDEVALALPTRFGADAKRMPRGPALRQSGLERAVQGLLASAAGRARRTAGEEPDGGHHDKILPDTGGADATRPRRRPSGRPLHAPQRFSAAQLSPQSGGFGLRFARAGSASSLARSASSWRARRRPWRARRRPWRARRRPSQRAAPAGAGA